MRRPTWLMYATVLGAISGLAPSVHADIAPPSRAVCSEARLDAPCTVDGASGRCALDICTGKSDQPFDCVRCVTGAVEPPRPRVDVLPAPLFSSQVAPSAAPAASAASPASPTAPPAAQGCSRCSAGEQEDLAPWAVASGMLLAAAVVAGRRVTSRR